ncbi:MAG: hypothetical protein ACLR23_24860 [Clostridia bacterium]
MKRRRSERDEPRIVEKIRRRANGFYNLGLDLANRQNLSGARQELVKAVSYDKRHTNARNLLGLVCFQMGEIGELSGTGRPA